MKKKTGIRLLSLLLFCALVLGCFLVTSSAASSGTCGENARWRISGKTLIIYGTGDMEDYAEPYDAPWEGYITSGNQNGGYITSIIIQDGITSIGDYSFYGNVYVTSVTIPSSVTRIGKHAFSCSFELAQITIPASVSVIEEDAFSSCDKLSTVSLFSGLKTLGEGAFSYCPNLTDIHIPASVVQFGNGAFPYTNSVFACCYSLQAFSVDSQNPILTAKDGVLFSKDMTRLIQYPLGSERTAYAIPEGVTAIAYTAFGYSENLKSVTIPATVTDIQEQAFFRSPNLNEIIFLGNAPQMNGSYLFYNNTTTVYYPVGNTTWTADLMQNYGGRITWTPRGPNGETAGKHGDNVYWMFHDATGTLTIMGTGTIKQEFSGREMPWYSLNKKIKSIVVESGITEIPSYVFEYLESVETVTLPDSLSSLALNAFNDCGSLNHLLLPSSLTTIKGSSSTGYPAFIRCESLTDIYYLGTEAQWLSIPNAATVDNQYADMTIHFLQLHEAPPTCTKDGLQSYYTFDDTSVYGSMYDLEKNVLAAPKVLPALGHTEVIAEAVKATCTEPGLTEGRHCSVCDIVLAAQEVISPTGHTEEALPGKAATCTENGLTDGVKCSVCNEVLVAQKGLPAGHNFVEGICTGCGFLGGDCGPGYNLTWVLTDDGVLTISGSGKMEDYSLSKTAPWYKNRTKITRVVIQEGVTSIGSYAFYGCFKLADVFLAEGVRFIGSSAFELCSKLVTVTIPQGVTLISHFAFSRCSSLTSITLPEGLTSIGEWTFGYCSSLKSITIPEGVSSIGGYAFFDCSSLTSINIPQEVTSIGDCTFAGCSSLIHFTIPEGVAAIGSGTFRGCSKLTSITIPEGVGSIGSEAFFGCSSLTSITIPEGVSFIGQFAFRECSSLTNITLPEGITTIGSYAFYECTSLTGITLPEGVTSIGEGAFYICSGLTSVTIPEGVTSIQNSTFYGCSSLTGITLPETVISIDDDAFCGCSTLTDITLPEGVVSIGDNAFERCTSLTNVRYGGAKADWDAIRIGSFNDCLTNATIVFANPSAQMKLSLPKGTITIEDSAFADCVTLKSVLIPASVKSIDALAFDGCTGLNAITFSGCAPAISADAFVGVTATVYYPENDPTWTSGTMQNYGGTLTWVPYAKN